MALAALVAVVHTAALAGLCPGSDQPAQALGARDAARQTLCLVNVERLQHGRAALRSDGTLVGVGRDHAVDMIERRYFAHDTPEGVTPGERIIASGYGAGRHGAVTTGENLGWLRDRADSPQDIVEAWMESPPHRRVILFRRFRHAGVAAVDGVPVRHPRRGTTYALETGD
jgi:uncharacterized protein YkwD